MKELIKKIPLIGSLAVSIKKKISLSNKFTNSQDYWINRYKNGGNSGAGSYNNLAEFKGEIINEFLSKKKIQTVIELGCGHGNQLEYFRFPSYIGLDISDFIIEKCRAKFNQDESKQFFHLNEISNQRADVLLSLDVIYHLIEDKTYHHYMNRLFDLSNQYVIIYAIDDNDESGNYAPHVKPRKFTYWIKKNKPEFKLTEHIPNKYPFVKGKEETTSFADFYIYERNNDLQQQINACFNGVYLSRQPETSPLVHYLFNTKSKYIIKH